MEKRIISTLKEIAVHYGIEILYACESGSRAWGCPSADSDYDVRFIYKRKLPDYFSVQNRPDQLKFPIKDELDIYGWDIKKVLQLLYKSNSTPFEWLQSPVVYVEKEGFRTGFEPLLSEYFNGKPQLFHYLGIAKTALENMKEGRRINVKKMFYVIRPVLAAKWIADRSSYPPMHLGALLDVAPQEIRELVSEMITDKTNGAENDILEADETLIGFVSHSMEMITEKAAILKPEKCRPDQLDAFFQKIMQ